MKKYMISAAMRAFFSFSATVIWLGIWQTGFAVTHWLLYVPAVLFSFAAISGFCPGMIVFKTLFREEF